MISDLQFCETNFSIGIEVFNTVSCFAYIFVGLIILYAQRQKRKLDRRIITLGMLSIVLGLGSIVLHTTKTQIGLFIDLSTMLFLVLYVITTFFFHVNKFYKISIFLISILIILFSIAVNQPLWIIIPFAISGIGTLEEQLEVHPNFIKIKYLQIGIASLIIGSIFWFLDISKIFCVKELLFINGHVVWHITTSIIIYCVYKLIIYKRL